MALPYLKNILQRKEVMKIDNTELVSLLKEFIALSPNVSTNGVNYSFELNNCELIFGKTPSGIKILSWNGQPLDAILQRGELEEVSLFCYNRVAEIAEKGTREAVITSLRDCLNTL